MSSSSGSMRRLAAALTAASLLLSTASGCGRGKKSVPGLNAFQVGVLQGNLYASFVAASLSWDAGLTVPIPGLDGATVSVAPDLASPGTVFQLSIPLASLVNGGRPLPPLGLPDGRPLPDVRGGALPRWDTQVGQLPLSVYLSGDAFGVFIPIPLAVPGGPALTKQLSITIKDERGNVLGKAYAIPGASGSGSTVSGSGNASTPASVHVSGSGSGLFILLPYLGGAWNGEG